MNINDKFLRLCQLIEQAGASEILTEASVLACKLKGEVEKLVSSETSLRALCREAHGVISAFFDEHEASVLNDIESRSSDPDYNHPDLNGQAEFDLLFVTSQKLASAGETSEQEG